LKHEEIEERGIVEAYVRRQLAPEVCAAFEEHYFQCARCFDDVQVTEKLIQGVDHAVRAGLLDLPREPSRERRRWLFPAFAFASSLTVVLACVLIFVVLVRQPDREAGLRQELRQALSQARDQQARAAERDRQAALEAGPEANVPVAILTASRSADASNRVQLGPQSRRILFWIDVPPQPPGTRFGVTLSTPDARLVKSIHGLERNSTGALTVSVPAADLPAGAYTVRLFNDQSPGQWIAEYRVNVEHR
jgi:Putative zinc-finger